MQRSTATLAATVVALVWASAAGACPFCETEIGERVNAGIFNEGFWLNTLLTLLPVPVLLGVVALIHYGLPRLLDEPGKDGPQPPES